jgi:Rad3-related DNA helicase
MPYIYLLNEQIMAHSKGLYTNSIIVFDEGHNISSAACDGFSGKLVTSYFKSAIQNILDKNEDKLERKGKKKKEK